MPEGPVGETILPPSFWKSTAAEYYWMQWLVTKKGFVLDCITPYSSSLNEENYSSHQ
jgi:hypothetical protein